MTRLFIVVNLLVAFFAFTALAQELERDTIKTSEGDLKITFIGHGTLMFTFGGKVIHIDPWTRLTDYSKLPKADIILLTHEHRDHLDMKALEIVRTEKSLLVLTNNCASRVKDGIMLQNGDIKTVGGLKIEAVPAYNLVHMRSEGVPFH
ncbi:MAG: MBL fold metallo-hydrolase, partial [Deltaproteobacteria bacterium]|nr:MBL fold metallo-hydrolase [Deltaproteobacteria bacterium]